MMLIADSGATKTDWGMGGSLADFRLVHTEGINPFHQSEEGVGRIIAEQLVPQLPCPADEISCICFYGAGCTPEKSEFVVRPLRSMFPSCGDIQVESDLLGAARALCKRKPGIACILGTGSNSCLYDGDRIVDNIPPLGYMLGDEGSGAYIGKRFLSDCMKRCLPKEVFDGLLAEYRLTPSQILEHVYRMPQANRFLAGFAPYIYKCRSIPAVRRFLIGCFDDFFRRNVYLYGNKWPVSFVGSVAWHFQEEIRESAAAFGFAVSRFVKSPIGELAKYHLENIHT